MTVPTHLEEQVEQLLDEGYNATHLIDKLVDEGYSRSNLKTEAARARSQSNDDPKAWTKYFICKYLNMPPWGSPDEEPSSGVQSARFEELRQIENGEAVELASKINSFALGQESGEEEIDILTGAVRSLAALLPREKVQRIYDDIESSHENPVY